MEKFDWKNEVRVILRVAAIAAVIAVAARYGIDLRGVISPEVKLLYVQQETVPAVGGAK